MRDQYATYSKYYDHLEGSRNKIASFYIKLIEASMPSAKSLLELACGTGSVLEILKGHYEVEGLDNSSSMLEIAKRRLKSTVFYLQDMRNFNTHRKYDVVLCPYNAINHLDTLEEWETTFKQVRKHLKLGGLFVFDANTKSYLEALSQQKIYENKKVKIKISKMENGYEWHTTFKTKTTQTEETIWQSAFEVEEIVNTLLDIFLIERIVDKREREINANTDVAYFVCRAKT